MSNERVTSMEVARKAGVSRVCSPGASVSPKMCKRVLAAAKTLGCQPNNIVLALLTGSRRIIGLAVDYLDNQFYPQAIERRFMDGIRGHNLELVKRGMGKFDYDQARTETYQIFSGRLQWQNMAARWMKI